MARFLNASDQTKTHGMDTALGDAGMASLRLEDDAVDSTEEAATLDSLPLEMLLSILAHVTPAETLRHAPAVCKSWQSAVIGASESLWMPHLAKDYPLFCECPLDRPARDAYDQARSGAELPVQLLNPGLTAGTFGATSVCTARYSAVDRADWLNAGCLIVKERGPGLISVHGKRLRRVEGVQEHAPMEPSFAALRPGEMVELQWKKGPNSPGYNCLPLWSSIHRLAEHSLPCSLQPNLLLTCLRPTPEQGGLLSSTGS